uniref:Arrestin C-terminal-like domain-containing protein n=1 Tax=Mastacembelus armatus TaxID=205130 RepID=A0A3Q3M4Z5_9TELE
MTIKHFSIEYDAINSKNTFTNGDTINGRIIVEVSKQTRIQSLVLIATGKARVCWQEQYGDNHHVYWADEKYYSVQHHILREARQDGTEVIAKGRHIFPFSFKIPDRCLFFDPQYGCKDKAIKLFGSGTISMDVYTKKMGYEQGEALQIILKISNHSTRSVKPKFILYEKRSFFAQGHRKLWTNEILKQKTEAVAPSTSETVTKVITIPRDLPPSILNCAIIKMEYRLKVNYTM